MQSKAMICASTTCRQRCTTSLENRLFRLKSWTQDQTKGSRSPSFPCMTKSPEILLCINKSPRTSWCCTTTEHCYANFSQLLKKEKQEGDSIYHPMLLILGLTWVPSSWRDFVTTGISQKPLIICLKLSSKRISQSGGTLQDSGK